MTGTITTVREYLLETVYVESCCARFTVPDSTVEVDSYVGRVGEESDCLLVPTR